MTPRDERPLPQRVTMPLLEMITQQSMDEDYQHVAERRRAAGRPTRPPRRRTSATVVAVTAFGLLVAVAAVQTSRDADAKALGRSSLVERIGLEKENVTVLQDAAGELRDENAGLESDLRELRGEEAQVTERVSRMGARTGYLAVRGPGIRIVVDDTPGGDATQTVRDNDLINLVDGLWAAGAEAIAINGQRLTVLSPIQNSGRAIHVNVRPLNPPYEVVAIGDPDTLEARLLASTFGSVFFSVARTLGFVLRVEDEEQLELPSAHVRALRKAEPKGKDQKSPKKRASDDGSETQSGMKGNAE